MSKITVENLLQQIVQLPSAERDRLRQLLDEQPEPPLRPKPQWRRATTPMPDSTREVQWIAEHWREYPGEWVALDGDRLIAHSKNHEEVWALADADGAYLPLIDRMPDPNDPPYVGF